MIVRQYLMSDQDDAKIIEQIMKILVDSNKNDPWILARQIYREVFRKELELEASRWQRFAYSHNGGSRSGH